MIELTSIHIEPKLEKFNNESEIGLLETAHNKTDDSQLFATYEVEEIEEVSEGLISSRPKRNTIKKRINEHIDYNIAGKAYDFDQLSLAPFVAGFLQEIISSPSFKTILNPIREKIKHLSFLVHLACRFDDFEAVFDRYKNVEADLISGVASWTDEDYFRTWEQKNLTQIFFKDQLGPEEEDFQHLEPKVELNNVDLLARDTDDNDNDDDLGRLSDYDQEFTINSIVDEKPPKKKLLKKKVNKKKTKVKDTFYCPQCKETLKISEEVTKKKHFAICRPQRSMSCMSCEFTTKHQKRYDKHLFEKHEQTLCSICGMNFETFESFTAHVEAHLPEKCEVCGKAFKNKDFLRKHMDSTHNRTAREMCPVCGKIYKNVANHVRIAHEYETKQCPHCPYSSKISTDLNRHILRTHTEETVTTCPYCAKTTKNIKRHLKINKCDRPEDKVFAHVKCERCEKTFSSKEHMKRHVKRIHDKILDVHCLHCDYKTYSNFNLRIHVTRVHEGKQLKQSCPYCHLTVISLDWHINMYHAEKAAAQKIEETTKLEHPPPKLEDQTSVIPSLLPLNIQHQPALTLSHNFLSSQ